MKKLFVILASVFVFFGSNAFASSITINVFNADDTSLIQDWKNSFSGNEVVLEKFEGVQRDWYTGRELSSINLGTFDTTGASVGQGSSSYNSVKNESSSVPYFRIANENIYGRTGSDNFLDSADC